MKRRLAAILAADIVGYSRLMEADETGTLLRLRALFQDVVRPVTRSAGGRIVKLMGDGLLADFPSAVDAVTCAAALQQAIREREKASTRDRRLVLRIGINLGDIILQDNDIFGDGVIIAARLEALAEPGSVLVSGSLFDMVEGKTDLGFQSMGAQKVKNIERPIRMFRLEDGGTAPAPEVQAPSALSIAVLPFDNISDDAEQRYFSDGISEDVITDLSGIPGLFVASRNSSFAWRDKSADAREIATALRVRYVLEGSVRKSGDRVRINAQLIDGETGGHLWAERLDRDMADIFAIQDEITQRIVRSLQLALGMDTQGTTPVPEPQIDGNAYDLVLQARQYEMIYTPETSVRAIEFYRKAIDQDASFAVGHAGLAYCLIVAELSGWPHAAGFAPAMAAAEQAVALDPRGTFGLSALALAHLWVGHVDEAVRRIDDAISIAPGRAELVAVRGNILCYAGDADNAIDDLETALHMDMAPNPIWLHFLGHACYLAGQYEKAAETFRQRIEKQPQTDISRGLLVCALGQLGRVDEARAEWDALLAINPRYSVAEKVASLPYRDDTLRRRILDGFGMAGIDGPGGRS